MKRLALLAASAALFAATASAETIVLETEAFADWGGWVNDPEPW